MLKGRLAGIALAALLLLLAAGAAQAQALTVFAAASLKNALDEIAALRSPRPVLVYGASSALARQIENGAPADVFVSADQDWMDYLEKKGLLVPGSRRDVVGNRLALISPAAHPVRLEPAAGFPLGEALGPGRLAIADPQSVPAGKYARAALEKLGVWPEVAGRLAPAENVRAALALVARGEAPLGMVYLSDVRDEPRVALAGLFPATSHPPIVYPAAAIEGARAGAAAFLDLLASPGARAIFERHGFTVN
ncbi:MAG TPA: molybdate ABC transporter substrate-binding protein [Burkholderiales bacterium]